MMYHSVGRTKKFGHDKNKQIYVIAHIINTGVCKINRPEK